MAQDKKSGTLGPRGGSLKPNKVKLLHKVTKREITKKPMAKISTYTPKANTEVSLRKTPSGSASKPSGKKAQKFSRQLDKAEGKLSRISYKAGKKEAKVIKKTEKRAAKAGVKLNTGYLPSVKKTLRADGKWPVSPKKK
jgi:hypothetical protein